MTLMPTGGPAFARWGGSTPGSTGGCPLPCADQLPGCRGHRDSKSAGRAERGRLTYASALARVVRAYGRLSVLACLVVLVMPNAPQEQCRNKRGKCQENRGSLMGLGVTKCKGCNEN